MSSCCRRRYTVIISIYFLSANPNDRCVCFGWQVSPGCYVKDSVSLWRAVSLDAIAMVASAQYCCLRGFWSTPKICGDLFTCAFSWFHTNIIVRVSKWRLGMLAWQGVLLRDDGSTAIVVFSFANRGLVRALLLYQECHGRAQVTRNKQPIPQCRTVRVMPSSSK